MQIFEQMKVSSAGASEPHKITGFLEYAMNYYRSGSKQPKGSRLDFVVETARSNAINSILVELRRVTDTDLGDDPEKWLKQYPPPRP